MKPILIKNEKILKNNFFEKFYKNNYKMNIGKDYFNYIDTKNSLIFEKSSFCDLKKLIQQIDNIFIKSYNFYINNININLLGDKHLFIPFIKKRFLKNQYLIGRYDFLIDKKTENLKCIEFNANTPGMITEINHISKILKPKNYTNYSSIFKTYIKNKFKKYKGKTIGILLPYSFSDEDFLTCLDYYNILLKDFSNNIIIGDVYESNIIGDNIFTIKGKKIDILLNFFPLEFFLTDLDYFNSFFKIVKNGGITIFNNTESIVLQDKLLFAVIWENLDKFDKIEQEIILKHIPFTTRIFQENDKKYLAKYRWGRVSEGIFENNFYTKINNKNDFVFQEKITSKIYDKDNNFLVLGIFTNLKSIKGIISRKQNTLISEDDTVKIINCYTK